MRALRAVSVCATICPHRTSQGCRITSPSGNGRQDVLDADSDRLLFLDLLAEYSHRYHLEICGYCLMGNHFHPIAVPPEENSAARTLRRL
jgi:hypothetical protein